MSLRSYARAKETYDAGKAEQDPMKRPSGPAIDMVREITFELAQDEINRRRAEAEG